LGGKVGYQLSGRHLLVRIEGDYATEELRRAVTSGLDELGQGARALVLLDARATTARHSSSEIRELGMSVGTLPPRIERIAIVVSSDVHFGLARMGSMFAGDLGASSDVFRDIAEARSFLDLPPGG